MKKIKYIKKISKDISKKVNSLKPVQIPLIGVIIFCLLLAGTSFFAGVSWLKTGSSTTSKSTSKNIFAAEKNNKPEFNFFVMSFCPYGNQIEDVIRPIADLLGDKADIHPRYIFDKIEDLSTYCKQTTGDPSQCSQYVTAGYFKTESECKNTITESNNKCLDEKQYLKIGDNLYSSLHGRVEANQNVREICAFNIAEDKSQWWDFVDNVNKNCNDQNADTCWEEEAKKANFDTNEITECFNTQAGDLIEKEIALTTQYKVQGSPTLIINGVNFPPESAYTEDGTGTLKVGSEVVTQDKFRTPNTLKEAVCASFEKAPKECKTELQGASTAAPSEGGC